ncbi:MAG: hypothetical protein JRH15_02520 [Deltaproteobacteria bacterium]|nr:hypothetical protein [Deltaproteobacteria bacterium]
MDQEIIRLWYDGLGNAYRATRGQMGTAGCHDIPRHRIIYYAVVGIAMAVMSVCCLFVISIVYGILALDILCAVAAAAALWSALSLFNAARRLSKAVKSGTDADIADPVRMKAMRKAVKWGQKKGFVRQNREGGWHFTDMKSV